MSNEQNGLDMSALLDKVEFPAMHVDSSTALAGGRRRVRRHRAQVIVITIVALLVLAPGGWLVSRAVDRSGPVPAGQTTKPMTTGLFARSGDTGNLGNGRVRLYPPTSTSTQSTNPSTFQVTRTDTGLRIALIKGDITVDLPQTGGGSSGLFQSVNGTHTVFAVEVPSGTTSVTPLFAGDDGTGSTNAVGSTLADGTPVVLIETYKPLKRTVRSVIWRRAGGSIGATNGERPSMLTQHGDTFYYFTSLGAFGIFSSRGGSDLVPGRGLAVGAGVEGTQVDFVVAGLYPHGVRHVRLTPAIPGATVAVTRLPGTTWDLVTARYRGTTKQATPKIVTNYGTWDPSNGEPPATAPHTP